MTTTETLLHASRTIFQMRRVIRLQRRLLKIQRERLRERPVIAWRGEVPALLRRQAE